MSESKSLENYLGIFRDEDKRHLSEVRKLRRTVWADTTLEPLTRAVLGLTGSYDQLNKYERLAARVDEGINEPVVYALGSYPVGPRKSPLFERRMRAGIISGPLQIDYADLHEESGTMSLSIPVDPLVVVVSGIQNYVRRGKELEYRAIHVVTLSNHEFRNDSTNPDMDYSEDSHYPVYIGRDEINRNKSVDKGIDHILGVLQDEVASLNQLV